MEGDGAVCRGGHREQCASDPDAARGGSGCTRDCPNPMREQTDYKPPRTESLYHVCEFRETACLALLLMPARGRRA